VVVVVVVVAAAVVVVMFVVLVVVMVVVSTGRRISRYCLNCGRVSRQNVAIDSRMTDTDRMATARAADELSGYSNRSQTARLSCAYRPD